MNYPQRLAGIPQEFTSDARWRMEVYRLVLFAGDVAWQDVTRLMQLNIIPAERGQALHEEQPPYVVPGSELGLQDLLANVPLSPPLLDATRNTLHESHA